MSNQTVSVESKSFAATLSVAASALLTVMKLFLAAMTGSLGILSEALHSLIDFGATIITWFAVRWADMPADEDHHYGHAKIESLAALFEALLLVGTASYIAFEASDRLLVGGTVTHPENWMLALLAVGIVVDFWRSRALTAAAHAHGSEALAADAAHFSSDMMASLAVLLGLCAVALGYPMADSIAALAVSAFIFWLGISLARKSIATLLDQAPEGATTRVNALLAAEPAILSVDTLRIRQAGPTAYVSLNAKVPRTLLEPEIESLRQRVQHGISAILPVADVNLNLTPTALDTETANQKILAIAAAHGIAVHHVVIQELADKFAVSFDVELPADMTLGPAHDQVTSLEGTIRRSLGDQVEVETHLEPRPPDMVKGKPATAPARLKLEKALMLAAKPEKALTDIHNIRIRDVGGAYFLHYHCRFDPGITLEACHAALDRVETRMMTKLPKLRRVVAHAEPIGLPRHEL